MSGNDDDLLGRLTVAFRAEAAEHAKSMSDGLLRLEKRPPATEESAIIEAVFRDAHSLKGAARAVKATQIEIVCQPVESVFAALKEKRLALTPPLADLMHRAIDLIEAIAASASLGGSEWQAETAAITRALDQALTKMPGPRSAALLAPTRAPRGPTLSAASVRPAAATVRLDTARLDRVMRNVEELLAPRLAAQQREHDLRAVEHEVRTWRKRSLGMQVALRTLERHPECTKLVEYLADEQVRLRALEDQVSRLVRAAGGDRRQLESLSDSMRRLVMEMQVQPWSTLLELFAREARELARVQEKQVEVVVSGGDIEVDRRLLDEMRNPLIHLVRNCIDHGIARKGTARISVTQTDSGYVTLVVEDDGAGVDVARLKQLAAERGLVSDEQLEQMSDLAALDLVFHSGLSTSALITDVSGRGLGLAIVREKVEQLGGRIGIDSIRGNGTRFTIVLPIRLATFRGTLVEIGGITVIIPSANIDRVARIGTQALHDAGDNATAVVDGHAVPFVWLCDALAQPRKDIDASNSVLAVLLGRGTTRIAFGIDAVVNEQEVLVKPLGPLLRRVRNVAGASVLGDGTVAPVLNVTDLLATGAQRPTARRARSGSDNAPQARQSVLVVEDSITSRALMKSILETAGYNVTTATDGIDAFTALKTQSFDLVVSDVDMPRMDGVDLTARLRADKQLADLPVILVTTMGSQSDRERGVEAGANAYLVKSSFDQSNLLEVVRRLI